MTWFQTTARVRQSCILSPSHSNNPLGANKDERFGGLHWQYCSWKAEKYLRFVDDTDLITYDPRKNLHMFLCTFNSIGYTLNEMIRPYIRCKDQ